MHDLLASTVAVMAAWIGGVAAGWELGLALFAAVVVLWSWRKLNE